MHVTIWKNEPPYSAPAMCAAALLPRHDLTAIATAVAHEPVQPPRGQEEGKATPFSLGNSAHPKEEAARLGDAA